jgi:hypothetical protein
MTVGQYRLSLGCSFIYPSMSWVQSDLLARPWSRPVGCPQAILIRLCRQAWVSSPKRLSGMAASRVAETAGASIPVTDMTGKF